MNDKHDIFHAQVENMEEIDNVFHVQDEDGNDVECQVLMTFEGESNGKNYILYTDDSLDEDGNTQVYASVYEEGEDGVVLNPIETDEEWEMVAQVLQEVTEECGADE